MNFYGLETERQSFVCDWSHAPTWYIERMKSDLSINTLRIPFSYQYIHNGDLHNLDNIISECDRLNTRVILDYHRTWSSHQGPTPEEGITMDEFIHTWLQVLKRYKDNRNVFGVGIFNEVQLRYDFEYTMDMHMAVIKSVELEFPGRFEYFVGCPGWGGNCSMIDPQRYEPYWNRTYVEVHKYIFSGTSDFNDWEISIPHHIPADRWFVGEVGWKQQEKDEREWAQRFLSYLDYRGIYNVCAWTIAHSGDTDGWWLDDCETFNWEKAALLNTLWDGSFKFARHFAGSA